MARAIRHLRADGEVAAVVDLGQIGTRTESQDSARWQYSIAYRICRELRLKLDLQQWWQERTLLSNEQRLVEFFWDIVLANTEAPVTIFFDEAERLIDRPFAGELFAALHSAYLRRVSEPEYSRLNFVVLGVAAPEQLCPVSDASPFTTGRAIDLRDFSVEECLDLAPGFDGRESIVNGLLERIHSWTRGQPFLTQKLARGVARKGGSLADLDPALYELFLAPGVSSTESYLAQMRSMVADGSARARQASGMLARLTKGGELIFDPGSPAQRLLHLGGFVSSDENGMLRFRNRVVENVFDADWARSVTPGILDRRVTVGAIAAGLGLVFAYWYIQVLPRPYIETLTFVTSDYQLAEQAHGRLRRLPGFGGRADELLTQVMVRRSSQAGDVAEARAADEILRSLPGSEDLANSLMADFWLRRSATAAQSGDRDAALVQVLAAIDAGSDAAVSRAANLIDGDYSLLDRSIHFDEDLTAFEVDWERNQIVAVDSAHRLHRIPLANTEMANTGETTAVSRPSSFQLTALQHVGVTRGFFVDAPGRAGALQLRLTVDHRRPSDLLVRLRAPSGAVAELPLPRRDGGLEQFIVTGAADNALAGLADESVTGQWEIAIFDRLADEAGSLISWGLSFPGVPQYWDDNPVAGIPLPDPERTEQITVTIGEDGRRAVAIPSRPDARGAASVWDVAAGEVIADLPLTGRDSLVRFLAEDRALVVDPSAAALWQIGDAERVAPIATATRFALPPAVSPDGRRFAVAEAVGERVRVSVFSSEDGTLLSRFATDRFLDWSLADGVNTVAVVDGTRRGRVIDMATGESLSEFFHDLELRRVVAVGDQAVAVDTDGAVYAWSIAPGVQTRTPADAVYLGRTIESGNLAVGPGGVLLGIGDTEGSVRVSRVSDGYQLAVLDQSAEAVIWARVDQSGRRLVTADVAKVRSWRLPGANLSGTDFGPLSAVALDSSGVSAVLGNRNGQVRLISDIRQAVESVTATSPEHTGHRGVITSLAFNASGQLVASGGGDGLVRIWDTETARPGRYLMRHSAGPINALAFSPDNRWIVSAGPRSARVFALDSGTLVNEIEVDGAALSVAFSPAGDVLAVGDAAGNIFLLAPDGSEGVRAIRGRSPVHVLRFGESAELLASGSSDGSLVFWNTLEGRALQGAVRLDSAIGWIEFGGDDGQLFVQSGSWIYRLSRIDAEYSVSLAQLLPSALRVSPALAEIGESSLRAVSITGGGRLILAELSLPGDGAALTATSVPLPGANDSSGAASSADDVRAEGAVSSRDWRRALGLELDLQSGEIRRVLP